MSARPAAAIALLSVVTLLAAGCKGSYSREPSRANAAESDAIRRRLARLPGVVRVDGGYSYNLEDSGSVSLSVSVRRGTRLRPIAGKAIEWVWRSRLPISAMGVLVGRDDDPRVALKRDLVLAKDGTALTRRYGRRPPSRER
jgi:hypothetical protein